MPYYTFRINSTEKNVLTKTFNTRDYFDLHFLLAGQDFIGVDLFCEAKFKEYTKNDTQLNCFDKFLYLFSQKVVSHESDISIVQTINEEKTTKIISLAKIYNEICDLKFKTRDVFVEGDLKLEFGIPNNLSDKRNVVFYDLELKNNKIENITDYDLITLSFLPVKLYKQISQLQQSNNKNIASEYFYTCFLRDLSFDTETFLYMLNFIFNENVSNFYDLAFKLNKDFHVNYSYIDTITMRELSLLTETINKSIKDKKNKSDYE